MILLTAVIAGLSIGVLRARWNRDKWLPPVLRYAWLVLVAFLPQLLAFYLPFTRSRIPFALASVCLVTSQAGLLVFCLLNRKLPGILILAAGLALNLLAIGANDGFMPISTETAARFLPADMLLHLQIGSRLSVRSKDILLLPESIVFPWLADRFVSPGWLQYRFVFSPGDVLVGLGAFWLLGSRSVPISVIQEREKPHVNHPVD